MTPDAKLDELDQRLRFIETRNGQNEVKIEKVDRMDLAITTLIEHHGKARVQIDRMDTDMTNLFKRVRTIEDSNGGRMFLQEIAQTPKIIKALLVGGGLILMFFREIFSWLKAHL